MQFAISYSIVTPESAAEGDYAETGMESEGLTLREAFNRLRFEGHAIEADCSPISPNNPPRWLTFGAEQNYRDGSEKTLSLHLPNKITSASALRVARLFGLRC